MNDDGIRRANFAKEYWKNKMNDISEGESIPYDFIKKCNSEQYSVMIFTLDNLNIKKIKNITGNSLQGAYVLLVSGIVYLLHAYNCNDDIVIGVPNKDHLEEKVNIVPARVNVDSSNSFSVFLNSVRDELTNCVKYANLEFEIGNDSTTNSEKNSQYIQLCVTMADLHCVDNDCLNKSKLNMQFKFNSEKIECTVKYDVRHYASITIERFLRSLEAFINVAIDNPYCELSGMKYISDLDYYDIMEVFNNTKNDKYPVEFTINQVFERQAELNPDNTAIVFNGEKISYDLYNKKANQLARILIERGVKRNEIVPIRVKKSFEMMISIMAILKAGAAYLPIDISWPNERVNFILSDCKARLMLSTNESNVELDYNSDNLYILYIDDIDFENIESSNVNCNQSSDDRAYVIYTSGSTGVPKGTIIRHNSVINRLYWMQKEYPLMEKDVILQKTPYTFDVSVWELFWWGFFGASVCLLNQGDEKEPYAIIKCIYDNKVTTLHFVPSMLKAFLGYVDMTYDGKYVEQLLSLKTVFASGEALSVTCVEDFSRILNKQSDKRIVNLYGPTEATVDVSYYNCEQVNSLKTIPIGKAIDNIRLYVMDGKNLCPIGVPGELCIAGIGLAEGYLNQPTLTEERFCDLESIGEKIYRTGDIARVLYNGNIEYLGRKDNQVKIRGFRVELDEIEKKLNSNEHVKDSIVFIDDTDADHKKLVACVILADENKESLQVEDTEGIEKEQVDDWSEVFDDKYSFIADVDDNTFNTIGWDSSYTGENIPQNEMKEWLQSAVGNILRFDLKDVLEIGCGTGMIMFNVLPHCDQYYGIDISREAVDHVQSIIDTKMINLSNIAHVSQMTADNINSIERNDFNMVILNSVVQYFPSATYLKDIIRKVLKKIKDYGCIFIGDVRNYDIAQDFYTSLALNNATPKTYINYVIEEEKKYTLQETELLLSPDYFIDIRNEFEEISDIEIIYKHTKYENEMSVYRYDVVLHVGKKEKLYINEDIEYVDSLNIESIIMNQKSDVFRISNMPNNLIFKSIKKRMIVFENTSINTVDEVNTCYLNDYAQLLRYTNEELINLSEINGYYVRFYKADSHISENMDAVFVKKSSWDIYRNKIINQYSRNLKDKSSYDLYSTPIKQKINWKKLDKIKELLQTSLPEYMIPNNIYAIETIPLLSNGKRDLKRVIREITSIDNRSNIVEPNGEVEEKLLDLMKDILHNRNIGINMNFFELGGDSIKAITYITRINRNYNTNLKIRDIFENQTVQKLAVYIRGSKIDSCFANKESGLQLIEQIKQSILEKDISNTLNNDNIEDFYPLSKIQKGMVFYSKLKPDEPIYLEQFIYELKFSKFNLNKFKSTLKMLCNKNNIFRTGFNLFDYDQPIQIVYKDITPQINIDNISDSSAEQQKKIIQDFLKKDLEYKYKFEGEILWRMQLYKLDAEVYFLALSFHHAILDGWSVATFVSEFAEVYNNIIINNEYKISSLASSYKDYVGINLLDDKHDENIQYWANALQINKKNKLPFNFNGKKISDVNEGRIAVQNIDNRLQKKIENACKHYGVTLKEYSIAVYVYWLYLLTDEINIITGIVSHDRPEIEDSEKIIGCFLNTIPLLVDIKPNITMNAFVKYIHSQLLEIKKHEMFLSEIAYAVGETSESGNPFFDTIFNYVDFHVLENVRNFPAVTEVPLQFELQPNEMTNTMLDFEVSKTFNRLSIRIKYSLAYYYQKNIDFALNLYVKMLDVFSNIDNSILNRKKFRESCDDEFLIKEYNDTYFEYDCTELLHSKFESWTAKNPDVVAVAWKDSEMTYGELNMKANRLAHRLVELGIKEGDSVALSTSRSFNMLVGMLAILKSGASYVPIDPEYPEERIRYILESSRAIAIVQEDNRNFGILNINISNSKNNDYSDENLNLKLNSKNIAYIIYTSGSTGRPKGVMIEHRSIVNLIQWMNQKFEVSSKDTLLFVTSMCFDLSVYDIFGMLSAGARIIIAQKEDVRNPEKINQMLIEEEITMWDSVPSTINSYINFLLECEYKHMQNSMRLVFMSGDWISVKLPQKIKNYFPNANVISLGGATEGTVWSIYHIIEFSDSQLKSIPYGKPIGNNRFYVLNINREMVPIGAVGELYIGGLGVAKGYSNNLEKTQAAFFEDTFSEDEFTTMYKTGDYGRIMPSGEIEFLGRVDHQIKVRGFRIELGEIENVLVAHDLVKEAVVIGKLDNANNNYLCAYVSFDESKLSINDLKPYLGKYLPDYMIPSVFVKLDKLPLNTNGKVDRMALPDPENIIKSNVEYIAPKSGTEEKIALIWSEILGNDNIGINDNFFDLGGNSILLLQVLGKMKKEFDEDIKVTDLFSYTTINQLAGFVEMIENHDKLELMWKCNLVPNSFLYSTSSSNKEMFSITFEADVVDKLKKLSNNLSVDIDIIFTAINMLTWNEIRGQESITLYTGIKERNKIQEFSISFNAIDEYEDLFSKISNIQMNNFQYDINDSNKIILEKRENEILCMFFKNNLFKINQVDMNIFDMVFEFCIGESIDVNLYTSNRINDTSAKHVLVALNQLIINLLEEYNKK